MMRLALAVVLALCCTGIAAAHDGHSHGGMQMPATKPAAALTLPNACVRDPTAAVSGALWSPMDNPTTLGTVAAAAPVAAESTPHDLVPHPTVLPVNSEPSFT